MRDRLAGFLARRWADLLVVELAGLAWLLFLPYVLTAHGHLDFARHAVGRDFVNLWTAGQLAFGPHRLDIFTPGRFWAWERRLFDPRLAFHFWSYPPPALLIAAPFRGVPYLPALILWSLLGLGFAWIAARAVFAPGDRRGRLLFLLSPAVAVNLGLGQNGALTAAILLWGLALWDRRPFRAGLLLGLLVFKPQIALLLPVAALADRRWAAVGGAALGAGGLVLLSVLLFGADAWAAFLGPTLAGQSTMLVHGRGPFMWMMTSAYMAARALGAPAGIAVAAQLPFTLLGAVLVWRAWRGGGDPARRAGVLILATFVASPQGFNYDLVAAAAPALWLARRPGLAARAAGTLLWALPLLLLAAQAVRAPPAPLVLVLALGVLYAGRTRPSRAVSASIAGEAVSKA